MQVTSAKITQRFTQIEGVELESAEPAALRVVESPRNENAGGT